MSPMVKQIVWFVATVATFGSLFALAYSEWQYRKQEYEERRSRFGKFKVEVPK